VRHRIFNAVVAVVAAVGAACGVVFLAMIHFLRRRIMS
jgi:hypothetical protein